MNKRQIKLILKAWSTCSSFGIKALALVLVSSGIVSSVSANHIPNFDKHISIMAREQPITEFFDELFGGLGLAVNVDSSIGGSINGDFRGTASEIYHGVEKAFQLTMYYDRTAIFIYRANQVSRNIIPMDKKLGERVIHNAEQMHVGDMANRAEWSDMGLVVIGTDRYQRQIESYVNAIVAQSSINAGQNLVVGSSIAKSNSPSEQPKVQIVVPPVAVVAPKIASSNVVKPNVVKPNVVTASKNDRSTAAAPKVVAATKVVTPKVSRPPEFGKSFRDMPIAESRQFERVFPIAPRFASDALIQSEDSTQLSNAPATIAAVNAKTNPTQATAKVAAAPVQDDWQVVAFSPSQQTTEQVTQVEAYEFVEPAEVVVQSKTREIPEGFQAVKVAEAKVAEASESEAPMEVAVKGRNNDWVELTNPGLSLRPLEPVKVKKKVLTPSSNDWTEIRW